MAAAGQLEEELLVLVEDMGMVAIRMSQLMTCRRSRCERC